MDVLSYSKLILEKVSFDSSLLRKELIKSFSQLSSADQKELINWCRNRFNLKIRLTEGGLCVF